ncbi:MAG: hemerythrin domain-containing protein [Sulfuritalea sp.]|nr:hemerythrin domain-containing protein [Sulfuritalea sp.]
MMKPEWSTQLSVGNETIDSEHRNLLKMINDVESAIRAGNSPTLPQSLKLLEDCVAAHFADEEKIAQAIGFDFTQNKLEHQYVQNELRHMVEDLVAKNGAWSESVAAHYSFFLSEWMVEHILQEDILMKPVLQTYPYDFKPD